MDKKNTADILLKRSRVKKASIGIIGLGYVGLPLVKEFQMREGLTGEMHLLSGIN